MIGRKILGGKYGRQFEGKSLRTISKNLGGKAWSKLGKNILVHNSENYGGKLGGEKK